MEGTAQHTRQTVKQDIREENEIPYEPAPADTSHVVLTAEIKALTELLARNTHDVWARQRVSEGWRYGPTRNDETKEHPSLVPYEQLSESEKQYDRNTALETLRLILALGYRVVKK